MSPNYYQNKLNQIEKLASEKRFEEAYKLVREELDLPYVPWKYEQFFRRWNDFLVRELKQLSPDQKATIMSQEEFCQSLASQDAQKIALALQSARHINLHPIQDQVKNWISQADPANRLAKIILMDELARQKIGGQVVFENQKVDLAKFDQYFDASFYTEVLEEFDKLSTQNPSLQKLAVQNFKNYLLANFPQSVQRPNLAKAIVRVTQKMLGAKVDLTTEEKLILKQIKEF
ncbi:DUF3196 family protein [Mycoplasma sp. ATU-Cv-703]|uniref:DUF3196 family protein n=1 Tax=Mycoplasma sp. ATU-Cv-703 TaxID=2498595 RepID=UPI000FDF0731